MTDVTIDLQASQEALRESLAARERLTKLHVPMARQRLDAAGQEINRLRAMLKRVREALYSEQSFPGRMLRAQNVISEIDAPACNHCLQMKCECDMVEAQERGVEIDGPALADKLVGVWVPDENGKMQPLDLELFHDRLIVFAAQEKDRYGEKWAFPSEAFQEVIGRAYEETLKRQRPAPATDAGRQAVCAGCGGNPNDEDHKDSMWGCPGKCPHCGEAFEHVRPGKSQPTCNCQDICDGCGEYVRECMCGEPSRGQQPTEPAAEGQDAGQTADNWAQEQRKREREALGMEWLVGQLPDPDGTICIETQEGIAIPVVEFLRQRIAAHRAGQDTRREGDADARLGQSHGTDVEQGEDQGGEADALSAGASPAPPVPSPAITREQADTADDLTVAWQDGYAAGKADAGHRPLHPDTARLRERLAEVEAVAKEMEAAEQKAILIPGANYSAFVRTPASWAARLRGKEAPHE